MTTVAGVDEQAGTDGLLDAVRRTVLLLAADAGALPEVVRVSAGDVSVEVRFPTAQPFAQPSAQLTVQPSAQPHIEGGAATAAAALVVGGPPVVPATPLEARPTLTSPAVGVFYRAAEPGAAPFVGVGDTVGTGQQIGIVEAMKLMIPIHAERAGRIAEVLIADGAPVEYGEALFALDGG